MVLSDLACSRSLGATRRGHSRAGRADRVLSGGGHRSADRQMRAQSPALERTSRGKQARRLGPLACATVWNGPQLLVFCRTKRVDARKVLARWLPPAQHAGVHLTASWLYRAWGQRTASARTHVQIQRLLTAQRRLFSRRTRRRFKGLLSPTCRPSCGAPAPQKAGQSPLLSPYLDHPAPFSHLPGQKGLRQLQHLPQPVHHHRLQLRARRTCSLAGREERNQPPPAWDRPMAVRGAAPPFGGLEP